MGYLKWGGLVVLFILWGCGGDGGSSGATGTLKVSITDAPVCGFDQVSVTVSKVRVHQSGNADESDAGWTDLNLTPGPKKINLAALTNGVLEDLGEAALPVGHYTQLRLVLAPNTPAEPLNNSVVINNVETAIDTPSAVQSGIKLIHEFDVAEDTLVDLVLDFDACKSIVTKGNGGHTLKPVITVIPQVVSGAIAGNVVAASPSPGSLLNPAVYAQQGGRVVKSTIPDADGAFVLSPLQQSVTAGDYTVVIVADNAATVIIASVPVTAQQTTTVSDPTDPIEMASSGTQTVSGAISPSSAEATVRAIQSVSINPPCFFESPPCAAPAVMTPIEIRSTSVMGSYALTLPVEAPWLGSYAAGIPIALAQQGPAGEYDLEVSAEGFLAQTLSVDLSGGNDTQDFTLTPE
jgi:hypothetical protein